MLAAVSGLALVAADPGHAAPAEDEAHRLDRLETRRLNADALEKLAPRAPQAPRAEPGTTPAMAGLTVAEAALKAREEQAIRDWRDAQARCGERVRDPDPGC